MKLKLFKSTLNTNQLEQDVNNWLSENKEIQVMDLKYEVVMYSTTSYSYSVLIMYKYTS